MGLHAPIQIVLSEGVQFNSDYSIKLFTISILWDFSYTCTCIAINGENILWR